MTLVHFLEDFPPVFSVVTVIGYIVYPLYRSTVRGFDQLETGFRPVSFTGQRDRCHWPGSHLWTWCVLIRCLKGFIWVPFSVEKRPSLRILETRRYVCSPTSSCRRPPFSLFVSLGTVVVRRPRLVETPIHSWCATDVHILFVCLIDCLFVWRSGTHLKRKTDSLQFNSKTVNVVSLGINFVPPRVERVFYRWSYCLSLRRSVVRRSLGWLPLTALDSYSVV